MIIRKTTVSDKLKTVLTVCFLIAAAGRTCVFGGEEATRGIIHDWKVAPLQTGIGYNKFLYLFDGSAHAVLIFTPIGIEQRSGIVSLSCLTGLTSNYGLQTALLLGSAEDNYGILFGPVANVYDNYGFCFGLDNWVVHNHGIQLGAFNAAYRCIQICGVNVADRLRIALVNIAHASEKSALDIGVFNGGESLVQIGLLNYNKHGLIPWFPLFNCDMRSESWRSREEPSPAAVADGR